MCDEGDQLRTQVSGPLSSHTHAHTIPLKLNWV